MDTTALSIAIVGTLVFLGVLIYKVVWFVRKISQEPEQTRDNEPGQKPGATNSLDQIQSDDK
jgi:hypothetical protein